MQSNFLRDVKYTLRTIEFIFSVVLKGVSFLAKPP